MAFSLGAPPGARQDAAIGRLGWRGWWPQCTHKAQMTFTLYLVDLPNLETSASLLDRCMIFI